MAKQYGKNQWIVGLLVSALLVSALLPTIYSQFNTIEADTTNFSTTELAVFSVVGVIIIIGVLYKFMKMSNM